MSFCLLSLPLSSWPPAGFRRSFRLSRRDKKTNKSMYECKKSEMYDMADVPTYEEVTTYRRQNGAKHRLVVLVGESRARLRKNSCHQALMSAYLKYCLLLGGVPSLLLLNLAPWMLIKVLTSQCVKKRLSDSGFCSSRSLQWPGLALP